MKITIEKQGEEPRVIDGVQVYRLLAVKQETSCAMGGGEDDTSLELAFSLAQLVEKEYKSFLPMIDALHSLKEASCTISGKKGEGNKH